MIPHNRRRHRIARSAAIAAAAVAGVAPVARGQIATLDKGHQIIVNNGLQIWGSNTNTSVAFNYNTMTAANMNAVIWGFPAVGMSDVNAVPVGQKWGRWTDWQYNGTTVTPQNALTPAENARKNDLIALQVGDEINQSDMETGTMTKNWLLAAGNGTASTADDVFPNSLLYVNSFHIINHANYANFLQTANPDAISWDSYPFANPHGHYITPTNWLALGQQFRRHGLGSYIGATNAAPRPYGLFLQTYNDSFAVDPGEVHMRWQQFAAWTMGYKFVDAFIYLGNNTNFGTNPSGPVYQGFKETARQSRNLGPALTRLISYGYGTSIVPGKNANGVTNPIPGDWLPFHKDNAPPSQRYLTNVSAINLGTKNNGHPGDVYVGFFNPLHASFGNPAGTTYFMVMNGLGGDLVLPNGQSDNTATVAQTMQQITLDFDFLSSGINSLQRLRRSDGLVEIVPLSHLSGSQYRYIFNLEGGTGDLFKYNDGSPFVGVSSPIMTMYWDADATAAGNNIASGAGLGGTGAWDSSAKWFNGAFDVAWAPGQNAVFKGTAGTVTLSSTQSANSLAFKSDGFTLNGSNLTLTGPSISVDPGMTATISSVVTGSVGLLKEGDGTLNLTRANTYTGGTVIDGGVLGIVSGSTGANPPAPVVNVTINNGATLRFNVNNLTLAVNRNVLLGPGGGVVDTNGNNDTIAGSISGSQLTKTGAGTLTLTNTNTYTDGTIITGGNLQVASDANLGTAPASLATNITLDGGTLRFGAVFDIANTRGIELGPAGGTIDTNGFGNSVAGYSPTNGFRGAGNLTKTGNGTFFASAPGAGFNTLWTGNLIIKQGTWKVINTDGLPYNVPAGDGLRPEHITLDGGTWQIGQTMNVTNGRRGITVASGGGTIDTQTFNLTWPGPLAGNSTTATLTKIGGGFLRLNSGPNGAATYAGNVNVNEGMLHLAGGTSMGDLASINLANVAGVTLNVTGNETIGSLAGGGTTGGNVTLGAVTLDVGGNGKSTTFAGVISGTGGLTKSGAGTMTLTGINTYSGATTVNAGTLASTTGFRTGTPLLVSNDANAVVPAVAPAAYDPDNNQFPTGNDSSASKVSALSITGTGQLDLGNSDMIVNHNGASPLTDIRDLIASGYNFGAHDGPGIISTTALATDPFTFALGYAENADLPIPFDEFAGLDVDGTAVLIKFTWVGDVTLDGVFDFQDLSIFNGNYDSGATSGRVWTDGDLNYDGTIDFQDLSLFNGTYDPSKPSLPEPSVAALIAVAATRLARRGRRVVV